MYEINDRDVVQTFYPFATKLQKTYTINLIETAQTDALPHYVFTIKLSADYSEFNLTGPDPPITNDIYEAKSYSFNSHFIYDTTWDVKMLPVTPYQPKTISCDSLLNLSSTVFSIDHVGSDNFITFTVTPATNTYIVGTLNILFGDVYPSEKTFYGGFNFSIDPK